MPVIWDAHYDVTLMTAGSMISYESESMAMWKLILFSWFAQFWATCHERGIWFRGIACVTTWYLPFFISQLCTGLQLLIFFHARSHFSVCNQLCYPWIFTTNLSEITEQSILSTKKWITKSRYCFSLPMYICSRTLSGVCMTSWFGQCKPLGADVFWRNIIYLNSFLDIEMIQLVEPSRKPISFNTIRIMLVAWVD